MLAELGIGLYAAAGVIQIDMLACVEAGIFGGAQVVDTLRGAIGGISLQEGVEFGVCASHA